MPVRYPRSEIVENFDESDSLRSPKSSPGIENNSDHPNDFDVDAQLAAVGLTARVKPRTKARALPQTMSTGRIEALDLARGFAILLMILSHGVKGLLSLEQFPDWGLVPIHLVTKFSSSLFILVFGMSLATAYLPHVGTDQWPRKRKKLLVRAVVVLFWYKVLTILEMSHLHSREQIIDALLYQAFPSYVEILGYYAIALLWIPFALPLWKSASMGLKLATPLLFLGLSTLLSAHFGFFGSEILQALLVEHSDYYTWGQLSRAPLVFVGLLLGGMLTSEMSCRGSRLISFSVILAAAVAFLGTFYHLAQDSLHEQLVLIAKNAGKHPPELMFMLFSLGGALLLLGLAVAGGNGLARILAPVTLVGKNSLQAFVFHIVVLFVVFRFLLAYFHNVDYVFALNLAGLMILATMAWLAAVKWVKENG